MTYDTMLFDLLANPGGAMVILAIESSCDETAAALYSQQHGLLKQVVYTQAETHAAYGGVVPELASRDHIRKLLPVITQALQQSGCTLADLTGIGYTAGPGLIGALMVGASVAKSLAYACGLPSLGVHHIEAHIMAVMLSETPPSYPFVALVVSGGHTLLVDVRGLGDYQVLGQSIDDAAGEAFDKTAKLLGLPYPGGPHLARLAELGDASRFHFTRPLYHEKSCRTSFSGLKTQVAKCYQAHKEQAVESDIAAAFQEAVVDVLLKKTVFALAQTGYQSCVVVGGVSANKLLRASMSAKMVELGVSLTIPQHEFCTDNAAMVAVTAAMRLSQGQVDASHVIEARARWSLDSLTPP